ncbi:MAG: hypothetical protein ACE5IK_14900, partial [Acidobacteriota bacterium]
LRRAGDGDGREVLTRAMADLQDALGELSTGSRTPSQVEESLLDIEARVIDALLDGLDPDERQALDETCDRRLARYGKDMTPAVRALTRRRCLETQIRKRCKLPRLSLLAD